MSGKALGVLAGLGGVWGTSFLSIKILVREEGIVFVVASRLVLGAVSIAAIAALASGAGKQWSAKRVAQAGTIGLLANVCPYLLTAWAEVRITSGLASVLQTTIPLFTYIFCLFTAEERLTRTRVMSLGLGLGGVVALAGVTPTELATGARGFALTGECAMLLSSACYAGGIVLAHRVLGDCEPLGTATLQLVISAAAVSGFMVVSHADASFWPRDLSGTGWAAVVALGVGGTGVAYAGYFWLIREVGSVRASMVTYIVPVVGVPVGVLALGEGVRVTTIIGAVMLITSAVVCTGEAPNKESRLMVADAGPPRGEREAPSGSAAALLPEIVCGGREHGTKEE